MHRISWESICLLSFDGFGRSGWHKCLPWHAKSTANIDWTWSAGKRDSIKGWRKNREEDGVLPRAVFFFFFAFWYLLLDTNADGVSVVDLSSVFHQYQESWVCLLSQCCWVLSAICSFPLLFLKKQQVSMCLLVSLIVFLLTEHLISPERHIVNNVFIFTLPAHSMTLLLDTNNKVKQE